MSLGSVDMVTKYVVSGNIKSVWAIFFSIVAVCFVWADLIIYSLMFRNLVHLGPAIAEKFAHEASSEDVKWYAEMVGSLRTRRSAMERELSELPFSMRPAFAIKKLIGWSVLAVVSVVWIDLGIFYLTSVITAVVRKALQLRRESRESNRV